MALQLTAAGDSRRLHRMIAGGAVLLALAWWLTFPAAEAPPQPSSPVVVAPAPPPITAAPVPPAPAAPAPTPDGLRLFGLTGSGAIIGLPDGSQRLVRIGGETMPGVILVETRQHSALLRSAAGEYQLDFQGVAAAPGQAAPAPQSRISAGDAQLREETLRYRLGLEPHRANGRVSGFTIRPSANLPALLRAGLRTGDRIVSVNGNILDEERMLELAWTIANSERTEFEFERAGRRSRVAVGRN